MRGERLEVRGSSVSFVPMKLIYRADYRAAGGRPPALLLLWLLYCGCCVVVCCGIASEKPESPSFKTVIELARECSPCCVVAIVALLSPCT